MPPALSFLFYILILIVVNLTCLHCTGVLVRDNVNVLDNQAIFLSVFDDGESHASQVSAPTSSSSKATLVSLQERIYPFECLAAEEDQINFAEASFAGPCLSTQDRSSNDVTVNSPMALHRTQAAPQTLCYALHHMQPPVANGVGQILRPRDEEPQTPADRARELSHLVARTCSMAMGPATDQVSKTEKESSPKCQEFEATWSRASSSDAHAAGAANAHGSNGAYGSYDGMEHAADADDAAVSAHEHAAASATTADAAPCHGLQCSAVTDDFCDGAKFCDACHAQDAAHAAASGGNHQHGPDDDVAPGRCRATAPHTEGGERIHTQGRCEGWGKSIQRSTGSGEESGFCAEGIRSLHFGAVPITLQLEEISFRCRELMAGLCCSVYSAGTQTAGSGCSGQGELPARQGDVGTGARSCRSCAGNPLGRGVRRCSQCAISSSRQNHREHEWSLAVASKSSAASGSNRCRGKTAPGQETSNSTGCTRCSHAKRGPGFRSWWTKFFFWPGWLLVTSEYNNREPASTACSLSSELLVAKWSHSITFEPTFLTEWGAVEKARALAFELDTYNGIFVSQQLNCNNRFARPSTLEKRVRFSGDLDVRVGDDDSGFVQFTVPCRALKGVMLQGHPGDPSI